LSFKQIPIGRIAIPEVRASSQLTEEQKAFFEGTVEKYGVLQPIIVRPIGRGRYELIAGKTRLEKLKREGVKQVEAKVVQASSKDAMLMHLAENFARGSVDPISTAKVIMKALDEGAAHEEIAKIFNHTVDWVKFMVSLLKLPEVYQSALKEGRLNVTHIREAFKLPDFKEVDAALQAALNLGWSASVLARYVKNRLVEHEAARHATSITGIKHEAPPPEPERLVNYEQCFVCGRTALREQIRLPTCCDDCYNLARYITTQIGTGEEAMQRIFKAFEAERKLAEQQRSYAFQISTQPQQVEYPTPSVQTRQVQPIFEMPMPIEDEKLRSYIKRMIKEELQSQRG